MHNLGKLIEDHETLDSMASNLMALCASPAAQPHQAYDQLRSFKHVLDAHLAAEADFLYADHLRAGGRLATEVEAFDAAFAELKEEWGVYLAEWSQDNVEEDWGGFSRASVWMMERMRARIARENAVLYPLALQEGRIRLRAA